MSEQTEAALLELFKEKMSEISAANKRLRTWMYSLICVFGIGLLSGMYWAGKIDQKIENISLSVDTMTEKAEQIRLKTDDLVLFMAREFKYKPDVREYKNGNKK